MQESYHASLNRLGFHTGSRDSGHLPMQRKPKQRPRAEGMRPRL